MTLQQNLTAVESRIAAACHQAGRPRHEVRLLAVSKTHPGARLREAYQAGLREFGENRVQELTSKATELADLDLRWVMIGHVQRNPAAAVARAAAEVQSLDSLELAEALDRRLQAAGRALKVLVQVNTSGEASKSGLAPDQTLGFAERLSRYTALQPQGLMTIALPSPDPAPVAACFDRLRDLRHQLRDRFGGGWDELSMGMSGDLELAIERGSTCVRVGTAIFGSRP